MKITSQQTDLALPRRSGAEIIASAAPPLQPAAPNRARATALLMLGAVLAAAGLLTLKSSSA